MLRAAFRTLKYVVMAKKPPKDPLIVVLGATGTGKSQVTSSSTIQDCLANSLIACSRLSHTIQWRDHQR
jgi:hypothetical protein